VQLTRCEASSKAEDKRKPQFLHLWFTHPLLDEQSISEVTLFDETDQPIELAGGGLTGSNVRKPEGGDENLGWLTYTLSPGKGTGAPATMTIKLRYTLGPWKQGPQFEPNESGIIALGNGSQFNGLGQNAEGNAFFAIAIDMKQDAARQFGVVVVTKAGRELEPKQRGYGGGNGEAVHVQRFVFATALADIAHFELRTRPIKTAEYQNVCTQPLAATPPTKADGDARSSTDPSPAQASQDSAKPGSAAHATWSKTRELTVNLLDPSSPAAAENTFLDLDTGRIASMPKRIQDVAKESNNGQLVWDWVRREKIDVQAQRVFDRPGVVELHGADLAVVLLPNARWEDQGTEGIRLALQGYPQEPSNPSIIAAEFPATFAFRTREGSTGILRITHHQDGDKSIKLQYKLIELVDRKLEPAPAASK
jgi:hypothetical protein